MKKIYKVAVIIMGLSLGFWFIETLYFLVREGWHYEATNKAEIICDKIFKISLNIGFIVWLVSVSMLVDKIMKKL
jgi:hypothetical protein